MITRGMKDQLRAKGATDAEIAAMTPAQAWEKFGCLSLSQRITELRQEALMRGAQQLADTLDAGGHIVVVADYDCDGATACAVAMRGLRLLGAQHVDYLVPDRVVDGYGLTHPRLPSVCMRKVPMC